MDELTLEHREDVLIVHPAKQHAYEVAVALQQAGRLYRFVTGVYDKPGTWFSDSAGAVGAVVGRTRVERWLSKRRHRGLDPARVVTWPAAEILSRTFGKLTLAQMITRGRSGYLFANWATDRWVARALTTRRFEPAAVYAFLGGARQTFAACRSLGVRTVLDVPIMLDTNDRLQDERRILGLTEKQASVSPAHVRDELMHADLVIVPSPNVTRTVRAAGFEGRVAEVPFGADRTLFRPNPDRTGRFRVVCAGRIELRKGIHYLIDAWRQARIAGELLLAGSPGEREYVARVRRQYGPTVREAGNLTRHELATLFATADVFVLLSLAEGSALVTYEALAAGLPCIVTPETGSVVRDGVEGFIVPAGNASEVAARLRELCEDQALRARMSKAARARAEAFPWGSYHTRLVAAVDSALRPRVTSQTQIA